METATVQTNQTKKTATKPTPVTAVSFNAVTLEDAFLKAGSAMVIMTVRTNQMKNTATKPTPVTAITSNVVTQTDAF